jgi:hypothetical protein
MTAEMKWQGACAILMTELGLDMRELLNKEKLKERFIEAVETEKLNQQASTALLCYLYAYGWLLDIDLLIKDGVIKSIPKVDLSHPAFSAAERWKNADPDHIALSDITDDLHEKCVELMDQIRIRAKNDGISVG